MRTTILILILFVCFSACKRRDPLVLAPGKKFTGTLILATNSEPDGLNPLFAEMASSNEILYLGQRQLTLYDDKWQLVPDLAEKVPTLKNGLVRLENGKMKVTWQIKADAIWEDGVPVTGDDFVFAREVCLDPTQEIIDRDTCERVESIEVEGLDKKTMVVTWKQPYAFYNVFGVHPLLPAHALRQRYKKAGGGTNDLKKDIYSQRPLSNGPFKFKEWVPGQYITYVRNDKFKPLAKLEEVTFRIIPNNMSMESNLEARTIDGILPSGGLNVPQISNIQKRAGSQFKYYSVPGMVWAHIDFNLDSPFLKDIRVRRALAHAINRKQIIHTIYHDQYQIANTFLPPMHWGFDASVPEIPFDLKKAAQLLDEAGYQLDKTDQKRKNAKGEPLVIHVSAVAGIKDIEQFEQIYHSDLKTIGVELQIDNKPAKVFFGDLARHRKFPHLSFYSWVSDPGSWSLTLWHKDYIPSASNNWKGQNYPGWKNDEASLLLDQIPGILDEKKRVKLMKRVQQIWFNDLPAMPMYFRPVVTVTRPDLQEFRPTGTQTPVTWNAQDWTFEKQKR